MPTQSQSRLAAACVLIPALHCSYDVSNVVSLASGAEHNIPLLAEVLLTAATLATVAHLFLHHGWFSWAIAASHSGNLTIGWIEFGGGAIPLGGEHGHGAAVVVLAAALTGSLVELCLLAGRHRLRATLVLALSVCLAASLARRDEPALAALFAPARVRGHEWVAQGFATPRFRF